MLVPEEGGAYADLIHKTSCWLFIWLMMQLRNMLFDFPHVTTAKHAQNNLHQLSRLANVHSQVVNRSLLQTHYKLTVVKTRRCHILKHWLSH